MYTKWTQHLETAEEKARFESQVRNSRPVLDRILEILKEDIEALERSEIDVNSYDTPGWAYKQAHKNGYRSYHNVVSKLLNLDQQRIVKPNDRFV